MSLLTELWCLRRGLRVVSVPRREKEGERAAIDHLRVRLRTALAPTRKPPCSSPCPAAGEVAGRRHRSPPPHLPPPDGFRQLRFANGRGATVHFVQKGVHWFSKEKKLSCDIYIYIYIFLVLLFKPLINQNNSYALLLSKKF